VKLAVGSVVMIAGREVSGRRDSNPRLSAWEADVLPLNYSRVSAVMTIGAEVIW
jgi:hypothetical protein